MCLVGAPPSFCRLRHSGTGRHGGLDHLRAPAEYRRSIIESLLTERNHICSVCVSNGHCESQFLAQKLEITHVHYPYRYPRVQVDASHDRFVVDPNRCILCTRCVRVCDEIEGAHTWDVMGRGVDALSITDLNQPWDLPNPAPVAASACKCVPRALYSKRVDRWWKC